MEKLLSKKIREAYNINLNINYIDYVKSSIFTVAYLYYLKKYIYKQEYEEFIKMYNYNKISLFDENIPLFNNYKQYRCIDENVEKNIANIFFKHQQLFNMPIKFNLSALYENLLSDSDKKLLGQVYTPKVIINYMINSLLKDKNITLKTKFLDPACGGGYFLINLYTKLKTYYQERQMLDDKTEKNILENMIYGIDIDNFSVFLTKAILTFETNHLDIKLNIYEDDYLLSNDTKVKFDYILGNPPYIGHKNIDKVYTKQLKQLYSDVYYDKSDISYCFFKAGKNRLKKGGTICFITSRYFIEAKYADKLRTFIKENFKIEYIYDFNGKNIFKDALISPLIIKLKSIKDDDYSFDVTKYNSKSDTFEQIKYHSILLDSQGWFFINSVELNIYEKIKKRCNYILKDICQIKQGIITGCDKAFIVNDDIIKKYNLEKNILRKWIKNSNIEQDNIRYNNLYIIYSNIIKNEADYPNTINYLLQYKDRLEKRRECVNGARKWYELQWGRNIESFEENKIIFPYKSQHNKFYYDTKKFMCSADIYLIKTKNDDNFDKYLLNYLNSCIFEFYFHCKAKKVGKGLYEYYPNKLDSTEIYLPNIDELKTTSLLNKSELEKYLFSLFDITVQEEQIIYSLM